MNQHQPADPSAPKNPVPNGNAPASIAPDSMAPNGNAPDSIAPDSIAPNSIAPNSIAPNSIAPNSIAPNSIAPNSIAPNSIAPNSIAPNSIAPNSIAPNSIAPNDSAPKISEPKIIAPDNIPPLIFATNNAHKVAEIQSAIGNTLHVISLRQAGIDIDIPEPHDTLEANATEKSSTIHRLTNTNCFSEDTGLEVDALGGAPGVKSARYAGDNRSDEDNIKLLLHNLKNAPSRKARFRTVISLILNDKEYLFEGICEGSILETPTGDAGFGYDPVFAPDGTDRSFAEMTLDEKNSYSHRRKAADKLVAFLRTSPDPFNNPNVFVYAKNKTDPPRQLLLPHGDPHTHH